MAAPFSFDREWWFNTGGKFSVSISSNIQNLTQLYSGKIEVTYFTPTILQTGTYDGEKEENSIGGFGEIYIDLHHPDADPATEIDPDIFTRI